MGDIDTYQKLSRVYDSMMKAAKFTEAQNKDEKSGGFDSVSAIVDFIEANSGAIPKYIHDQPQDLVDQIIADLKGYNKSLIYEDKALAQQIEQYLQDKRIADQMKKDRQEAEENGKEFVQLQDQDYVDFKQAHTEMVKHDEQLIDDFIESEYAERRIQLN